MSIEQVAVTVTMDGKPYRLVPTYDACRVLNRLAGGMLPLFRGISNVDADVMALIVAAGAGVKGKAVEEIGRVMWAHGLEDLVDPLTKFLTLVCNGGRDPDVRVKPTVSGQTVDKPAGEDKPGKDEELPRGARLLDAIQDAEKRYGSGGAGSGTASNAATSA